MQGGQFTKGSEAQRLRTGPALGPHLLSDAVIGHLDDLCRLALLTEIVGGVHCKNQCLAFSLVWPSSSPLNLMNHPFSWSTTR